MNTHRNNRVISRVTKLAIAIALTTSLMAPVVQAKDLVGWVVSGGSTGIVEGQPYSLWNLDQRYYVQNEERWGVNLGWNVAANNFMKIKRQIPGSGPIRCGEIFALWIERTYYFYGHQTYGLNLTSDYQNPKPEWKFTSCVPGEVVQLGQKVGLTNVVGNDSVVGCKRITGVNLCWGADVYLYNGQYYRKADATNILGTAYKLATDPVGYGKELVTGRGVEATGEDQEPSLSPEEQQKKLEDEKKSEIPTTRGIPPDSKG